MTTDSIKEWIVTGRKYADAIDKDRGFESGVTDCLRGLSDALEAMAGWKMQALALEATWDVQAIGRIIKVPLGANILPAIQPAIEAMAGEVENLKHDIARHMTIANEAAAERDRMKAALELIWAGSGDLFATEEARKALGGDAS